MTPYYEPISYEVPPEEDGFLLKTILHHRMHLSRKLVSRLKLTDFGIMVNGARQHTTARVAGGDRVEIRMERETSADILPQPIPFDKVYEDEHLLIVNKEAGMVVHPTHGHYVHTLANAVVYDWQERGEQYRFRPVHRLDQETSGLIAIAKNPYVHQQLSEQIQAGQVEREYEAVVHGQPLHEEGTVDAPIGRCPAEPHRRIVTPDGYSAVTHYRTVQRYPEAALVRLRLETGRTHQIRVHMRHIGCPLVGDKLYGADRMSQPESGPVMERQALHACRLGFRHPVRQQWVEWEAARPADFRTLVDQLERSWSE